MFSFTQKVKVFTRSRPNPITDYLALAGQRFCFCRRANYWQSAFIPARLLLWPSQRRCNEPQQTSPLASSRAPVYVCVCAILFYFVQCRANNAEVFPADAREHTLVAERNVTHSGLMSVRSVTNRVSAFMTWPKKTVELWKSRPDYLKAN